MDVLDSPIHARDDGLHLLRDPAIAGGRPDPVRHPVYRILLCERRPGLLFAALDQGSGSTGAVGASRRFLPPGPSCWLWSGCAGCAPEPAVICRSPQLEHPHPRFGLYGFRFCLLATIVIIRSRLRAAGLETSRNSRRCRVDRRRRGGAAAIRDTC